MVNIPPRRVYYGYMETTQGIETLFRRYYPAMRRLATMLLHDEEAARDTVQDVFEKLLSRGVRPDRPEAGAYLLKAVRNACLNRIRDFDTETRLRNLYLLDSEAADADDWPDEALLALPLAAAITSFKFRSTPLPEALGRIARAFPETRINFIYNRLEDYKVNADVNAWYYIRDFYFGAYYAIRTRDTRTHFRTVSPSYYSFTAGWSHNDLNISIQAGSPFRSGREAGRMVEVAPRYHSEQTSYNRYYHRTFNLSLTYTIPYGKKVERDEDLQRGSSPQSGIVK